MSMIHDEQVLELKRIIKGLKVFEEHVHFEYETDYACLCCKSGIELITDLKAFFKGFK